jgi:hypothetical protein
MFSCADFSEKITAPIVDKKIPDKVIKLGLKSPIQTIARRVMKMS